jgi:hypothetical protein
MILALGAFAIILLALRIAACPESFLVLSRRTLCIFRLSLHEAIRILAALFEGLAILCPTNSEIPNLTSRTAALA